MDGPSDFMFIACHDSHAAKTLAQLSTVLVALLPVQDPEAWAKTVSYGYMSRASSSWSVECIPSRLKRIY